MLNTPSSPTHKKVGPSIPSTGGFSTFTSTSSVPVHPSWSVTVTTYVVDVGGLTVIDCPREPSLHAKLVFPVALVTEAVNVAWKFLQILTSGPIETSNSHPKNPKSKL